MNNKPYRWIHTMCLACLALALGGSSVASGQETRVDPEALAAWKAYGEFAKRLQGSETSAVRNSIKEGVSITKREFRQNRSGASLRLYMGDGASDDQLISVENERYRFELRTAKNKRDEYVLVEYHPSSHPRRLGDSTVRDEVIGVLNPHYFFEGQKPWEMFDPASRVKVLKTARIATPQGDRYRVDMAGDILGPPRQFNRVNGFILYDPGRMWCIDRAEYKEEHYLNDERTSDTHVVVTFLTTPHPSGFPLVSKQFMKLTGEWFRRKVKGEANTEVDYQVQVAPDDDESPFQLTAFGLPEPVGLAPREKGIPRYVWFVSAAAVFVVIAVVLRTLARRRLARMQG